MVHAWLFVSLGLTVGQSSSTGELRLPSILGDHMVLQRETAAPLWGWAAPGSDVVVRADWLTDPVPARAGANGHFRVDLQTPAAGGPHSIRISAGGEEIVLDDVWIGEVWLASGQSNMEWPLTLVRDGEAEIASADEPRIRFFDAANTIAREPAEDVDGTWQIAAPGTIREFSAVAYFFGRELVRDLAVPIGLIGSNWGGTPAEAWTSEESLRALGDFDAALTRLADERRDPRAVADRAANAWNGWWEQVARRDPGTQSSWNAADFDDSAWAEVSQPGAWAGELENFDGVAWMRRKVEIPASWEGKELSLELGPIDDMDTTWFQGVEVGAHQEEGAWATPRQYRVPAGLVHHGNAVIAVRVVDVAGFGGMSADSAELLLHPLDGSENAIPLQGTWRVRETTPLASLPALPGEPWFDQNKPTALYNGMIAPLALFAIRGAIWYQGESNVGRAAQYSVLFPMMIEDWRARFGSPFPFYFVQIAPFRYGGDMGQAGELRDAQLRSLATPDTGMVVTLDIGDPEDIHPMNKQEVGRRLALLALGRTYGRAGLVDSGPLYRAHAVEGESIRVAFDHVGGGLVARGGALTHFEIAGEDGRWIAAQATIDGESIVVSSPEVTAPHAVRYAWSADAEPNLFNAEGLPASTFRTR